jgi:uncharacterized membrane protein YeaQ/YmgE (transglycosylase-associated protein family)
MFEFILWILTGMVAGWVGYLAARTSEQSSARVYLISGGIGAVVGGFLARGVGMASDNILNINPNSLVVALVVASLSILVVRLFWPDEPLG